MNNKGQGTITKRANKKGFSYQAKVKVDGNYFSKTFSTNKEATAYIQDIQSRIRKGEQVDYTQIKKTHLSQIFSEYIKHHDDLPTNKKNRIEKLIIELGGVPLEKFTSNGFESFLKHKKNEVIPSQPSSKKNGSEDPKRTYAPATIRKYYYDVKLHVNLTHETILYCSQAEQENRSDHRGDIKCNQALALARCNAHQRDSQTHGLI